MKFTTYYVYKYSNDTDEYGQSTISTRKREQVDMYVRPYTHTNTSDMRYVDVEYVALTKEVLSDQDIVEIGGTKYSILYFLPTDRYNEVFMRRSND